MFKFKDVRDKHQDRGREIPEIEDKEARETAYKEFVISMVESWDFKDENGNVLPIVPSVETWGELKIVDRDELIAALPGHLFPNGPLVPKAKAANSSYGSTRSKVKRRGNSKSLPGLTTS